MNRLSFFKSLSGDAHAELLSWILFEASISSYIWSNSLWYWYTMRRSFCLIGFVPSTTLIHCIAAVVVVKSRKQLRSITCNIANMILLARSRVRSIPFCNVCKMFTFGRTNLLILISSTRISKSVIWATTFFHLL